MSLIVITPPAVEPVSLAEAKAYLRVDGADEDLLITGLIRAAREYCESVKGHAFYEQTLELALTGWPYSFGGDEPDRIILPRATPLRSIVSVKYRSSAGTESTWATSEYVADAVRQPGALMLGYGKSWPDSDLYPASPIRIRYVAGVTPSSPEIPFPEAWKLAMKLLIGHWYRNREAVTVGSTASVSSSPLAIAVDALLAVDQQVWAF